MTKVLVLLLALVCAGTASAGQSTLSLGNLAGYPEASRQESRGHLQLASALTEADRGRSSDADISELPDADDLASADLDLKLPEEELPDSDIPLTFNSKVSFFVRYFQNSGRDSFARWLSRSERYIPMMREVLKKEGLPEDLVYLAMIESGFSPHAYSVASAVGPWQFMSGTGKRYALRIDNWIDERRDPLKSSVAAALYLKELYALFNNDWYLAAAGYNAGENKILRAINMYNTRDFWEISKGEYLKRETKDYVPKLLAAAIIAKEPAKYGFADVAYLPPIEFDTVKIPSRTDLEVVAKTIDVPVQVLRELNPELRRSTTPPNYPDYQLKIPRNKAALFAVEYAKIPESERFQERVRHVAYRAKHRDTLHSIARRFKTTPQAIAELNNLGKRTRSLKGKVLTVPVQVAVAPAAEAPAASQPRSEAKAEVVNKYYTVKKGDTLHSLAKRFNVTAKLLSAWNNLKMRVALKPGKRIIVAKYQEKNAG
ncbi:lytic transglycosylase [Geomonas limicola]|uniref:Lytic transglycosylase n=1 Tax=Geomonas limicola TaxID=2740186 RepID=A0A6V8NCK2_9BACT|nr:lytic transglycosylase domain-containing protein [Geomonas limicola]GFO68879.1 lytic transglycosylase [Geomonas limicola]